MLKMIVNKSDYIRPFDLYSTSLNEQDDAFIPHRPICTALPLILSLNEIPDLQINFTSGILDSKPDTPLLRRVRD